MFVDSGELDSIIHVCFVEGRQEVRLLCLYCLLALCENGLRSCLCCPGFPISRMSRHQALAVLQ